MITTSSNKFNSIQSLSERIEKIRGLKPGSISNQYRQLIDKGIFTIDEAANLLQVHLPNLKMGVRNGQSE